MGDKNKPGEYDYVIKLQLIHSSVYLLASAIGTVQTEYYTTLVHAPWHMLPQADRWRTPPLGIHSTA